MATSSSDAIRPVSASDPDAVVMPPSPPTPEREPSALDDPAGEADLLGWVALPRLRGERAADASSPPSAVAMGTRPADRSRKVEPAAPIPADRITTLRRPLRVGSLEVTPIEVARTDVKLRRAALSG